MLNAHIEGKLIILTGDLRADYDQYADLPFDYDGRTRILLPNSQPHRERFGLAEAKLAPVAAPAPVTVDDYTFATNPRPYQLETWQKSKSMPAYAYLFEQGTGKTKVTIDKAAYLFQDDKIDALVVIAPNNVHANWIKEELPKHVPCPWAGMIYYADGIENFGDMNAPGLKVFCFNVEGFVSDKAKELIRATLKKYRCLLAVDESSRIKNHSAMRTKFVLSLQAAYRCILSGTPVTQGMEDLYTQFQFLDPKILACRTFYTFRARYCRMGGFKGKQIVGYFNIEELQARIAPYSTRVLKADVLKDLPPKVYQTLPFKLTVEQRRLYDALKRESLDELEDMLGSGKTMQVVSELAMTRILRLQQITSGLMPETDGLPIPGANARMDALLSRLDDLQGKAIIYARFRADIENIVRNLPKDSFVTLHGGTKQNERMDAVQSFQNDPTIRYFVGNPAAAGIGITLTAAEAVLYYSQDFNLEYRLQSEDRPHRIGQTKSVLIIDLIAEKTVDEKIVKALRSKHSLAKLILKDPASFIA